MGEDDYYEDGFRVMGSYIQPRHRDLFVFFEDEEPFPDKAERVYVVDKYNRPDLEAAVYQDCHEYFGKFYVFNDGTVDGPLVIGRNLERTYELSKLTFAKTNY